jgi:predicted tellurium resistance membrane protein TerC
MKYLNKKLKIQLICTIILIIVGVGLLIAGFSLPPHGVIDASVLTAFGEILTFVGALFGIEVHYKSHHPKRTNKKHPEDFEENP